MKSKAGKWFKFGITLCMILFFYQCTDSPTPEKTKTDDNTVTKSPRVGTAKAIDMIRFQDEATGKFGYKNKAGEVVVLPVFDGAMNFKTSSPTRVMKGKKFGYLDTDGNLFIPIQYVQAYPFMKDSEGKITAKVATTTGKYFYINSKGTCVRDC